MSAALDIRDVSKEFRIWNHPRDMLLEMVTGRGRHRRFKALDHVSFRVARGSIVGIMGRNGAGKSTLLRIIAGTLEASHGQVDVHGRISAILELGSGFHPDYSGRTNIRLGGLCLGMSEAEIRAKEDAIIEFSELRDFIDQPFRTYSSGMQARLTFAVATAVDPDILIVDEALSVGDARFQLKSFDRVRSFKKQGKTILLVSHDINAINSICDEAVLLERGVVHSTGTPSAVGNIYHEMLFANREAEGVSVQAAQHHGSRAREAVAAPTPAGVTDAAHDADVPGRSHLKYMRRRKPTDSRQRTMFGRVDHPAVAHDATRQHRYGNGAARIISVEFRDMMDRPVRQLDSLETYDLVCGIDVSRAVDDMCFGFLFRDRRGTDIFGWDSRCGTFEVARLDMKSPRLAANERAETRVRFRNNLAGGTYYLTVGLAHPNEEKYDLRFDVLEVSVGPTRELFTASAINLEIRPGHQDQQAGQATLWRKC